MGLTLLDRLGDELDREWKSRDYDADCFPHLSAKHLEKAGLHRQLGPSEILRWAVQGTLPAQFDPASRFGQPPITVFRRGRFIIDVLFWLDGTTNIHDHAFSGAFQVLAGSSIETTFAFGPTRKIDGHLSFGHLSVLQAELRKTGDVRPIIAGPSYIHALFHLDRPSVTLLVRALEEPTLPLPLDYHPSGVAYDPFLRDEGLARALEIVEMLHRSDSPDFVDVVGGLLESSDLYAAFRIIRACRDVPDQRQLKQLLDRVRDPEAASAFSLWLEQERTHRFLRKARGRIHDSELRFFLAVLLNARRGKDPLELVASFRGRDCDSAAQIAAWLAQLSKVTMRLQAGGTPWEPNVLNLPTFEDGFEMALADSIAGRERVFTPAESAFLDRLRALPHLAPLFAA